MMDPKLWHALMMEMTTDVDVYSNVRHYPSRGPTRAELEAECDLIEQKKSTLSANKRRAYMRAAGRD